MPVDDDNTLLLALVAVVEGNVHSNRLPNIVVVVGSDAVEDSHVDYRHRLRHDDYPHRQREILALHSPPTKTPQVKFHYPIPRPLLLNYDHVPVLNV